MAAANLSMYKKSALTLMHMARDLFLTDTGEKIPTILEYTEMFGVSRGIVQSALEVLTEDGSITMEKRGVLGTFLVSKDDEKLFDHTGWGAITGGMPIPLTPYFTSLATAVCEVLSEAPVDFAFAYMSGSVKRVEALRDGVYDFVTMARSAAQVYLETYDDLELCTELTGSQYCQEYMLYFMDPSKSAIEDGMRVGVDPVCMDQKVLTEKLCRGKAVEIVEFPFIGFEDIVRSGKIDCTIFRDLGWNAKAETLGIRAVPLTGIEGFGQEDTNTPVVLVRKGNYGIDRLLKKYLNIPEISRIQQEVLDGRRSMKFY